MNCITVRASRSYDVRIGRDLLFVAGKHIAELRSSCKAAIISDSNVWPLYGKTLLDSLHCAGFQTVEFIFSAGEEQKNGTTYLSILDFLAQNHLSRSDLLIALGGGVVGDITGFAAATYLRGIPYVQIPTTLLAMVDSSVGGKTAIDLPSGKNLAGAFWQPLLVLCDLDTLNSLPETVFRDGCAEVIKYGVLFDPSLFSHLESKGLHFDQEYVITTCVRLKRDVVAEDEFDIGARQQLNLGHTLGHGIEAQSNYAVSHGEAVAAGMAIISRAAAANHICPSADADRICCTLTAFRLPVHTEYSPAELMASALSDKKRTANHVNLIVPERIGRCRILPTAITSLQDFIEAGF